MEKLKGVTDPEEKKSSSEKSLFRVFEEEAGNWEIFLLAQGTIYPDVIESGGKQGDVIKSHHNVGGLPENLAFAEVIEPLRGLFKDEVRELGRKLGLPAPYRTPAFPGPRLGCPGNGRSNGREACRSEKG